MKTRLFRIIIFLALLCVAMPMMSQDWMEIQFKDGTYKKFYLKNVTEVITTKMDAEGVMHAGYEYLRVLSSGDVYSFYLSDIDNISFTKYDEEVARHNFAESNHAVLQVLHDNQTLAEAESHLDEIKNVESVEDAWSDGHELFVKVKGFGVIPFHFSHGTDGDEESIFNAKGMNKLKAMLPPAKANMSQGGKQLRAVIANQAHFDKRHSFVVGRNTLYSLMDCFQQSGIKVDYNEQPTIDFFYNNSSDPVNDPHIYDYDIIFLLTHGGCSEVKGSDGIVYLIHDFMTGDVLGEFSTSNPAESELEEVNNKIEELKLRYGADGLDIGSSCHQIFSLSENEAGTDFSPKWVYYPHLSQFFFRNTATGTFSNPQSIMFNGACQTLKGKKWHTAYSENTQVLSDYSLANEFINKNLGVYLGYNQPQSISPWAGSNLFYSMMNGYSLDKAAYSLPNSNKAQHFSENSAEFLAYLMRVPDLSNKTAGNVFIVSTHTEEANQDDVNQEYAQNHTVTLEGITSHIDETVNGLQYGFRYKEVDLGQYPLDSWSPIELWVNEASAEAELVPMTISSDKGNRLFKATLAELEQGRTYVYRAYTYDGMNYNYGEPCSFTIKQGGNFTINTCPDDHHPHMIDLGLPSGTKWACCNVGASKPEDEGGYYVWGATEEDEAKDKNNLFTYDEEWDYYEYNYRDIGTDIAGTKYDVAHVKWGGSWVMPNKEQIQELIDNCRYEWIEYWDDKSEDYLCGGLFTSSNGSSIFLPGHEEEGSLLATCWSSSLYDILQEWLDEDGYEGSAYILDMTEEEEYEGAIYGGADLWDGDRGYWSPVRPVISK